MLKSTSVRLIAALATYTLATALLFGPLVTHLRTSVLWEPGDLTSTARDYWAASAQGKTPFTLTKDNLVFAPEGQVRAPSLQIANAVQPAFVLALKRFLGVLGALNLYMLLGFVLSAVVMFALLDQLGFHALAGLFGGFAFAFNWWQYEQAFFGHIGLNHLWVLPAVLISLLALRRSRSHRRAIVMGVVLALSFYVFSYLGLFAATLALAFAILDTVGTAKGSRMRVARLHAEGWAMAGALLVPALVASRLDSTGFTSSFVFSKKYFHGAAISDYFLPPGHSPVFGRFFGAGSWPTPHTGEETLFFGWTTMLLAFVGALLWLVRGHTEKGERRFMLTLSVWLIPIGFLGSLPAYATVHGSRVPLPSAAFAIGTFTNWWKIYSRYGVLVAIGMVILGAWTVSVGIRHRRRLGAAAAVCALAFLVVEMLPGTPAPTWNAAAIDGATRWLERHPGGIVADYPMLQYWNSSALNSPAWPIYVWANMYEQTEHHHPLYSPPTLPMDGSRTEAIRLLTLNLDDTLTPGVLRAEHVRYVVVHDDVYRTLGLPVPRLTSGYREIAAVGATRIYTPRAPAADVPRALDQHADQIESARGLGPAPAEFASGFLGVENYNGFASRWMVQDGILRVSATDTIIPTRYELQLRAFSNQVPRHVELRTPGARVLGSADVGPDQEYRIGPFTLPGGTSRLELHADPGPQRLGDRGVSTIFIEQLAIVPLSF